MSDMRIDTTKTAYKPAALKSFGSLSDLTKGSGGSLIDGNMTDKK